jgi:hypothetical protein
MGAGQCVYTLATTTSTPGPVAVDANSIYFPLRDNAQCSTQVQCGFNAWLCNHALAKVPIAGGAVTTLATGLTYPNSVATDGTSVFVTHGSGCGYVTKVAVGGGAAQNLTAFVGFTQSVAVNGGNVFFLEIGPYSNNPGYVASVPSAGGATTTLASGPRNLAWLAVDSSSVYWTATDYNTNNGIGTGTLSKVPQGGGGMTTLVGGMNYPGFVSTDGTNLFWTDQASGHQELRRISVSGGASTQLGEGPIWWNASDGKNVYFASGSGIARAPVGGGAITYLAIGVQPNGLAIDGTSVYWADTAFGAIMKTAK